MKFDNTDRTRYYGLRKGDRVKCGAYDIEKAVVTDYGFLDNNRVYILPEGKTEPIAVVAEWCEILVKID